MRIECIAECVVHRFWAHIVKTDDGCWFWNGERGRHRSVRRAGSRTPSHAHKLAWEFANGTVPAGLHVLHTCDEPTCCRPDHLFLGTNADNQRDMRSKGRGTIPPALRGEDNSAAKLTNAQVREIRARYTRYQRGGTTLRTLAAEFGVSMSLISQIVRGKTWTHLT